jgi:hypothetical protein
MEPSAGEKGNFAAEHSSAGRLQIPLEVEKALGIV